MSGRGELEGTSLVNELLSMQQGDTTPIGPRLNLTTLLNEERHPPENEALAVAGLVHPPAHTTWKHLPPTHWTTLFGLYNISLYGGYITILPPIQLALTISPETAVLLRHPEEEKKVNNLELALEQARFTVIALL